MEIQENVEEKIKEDKGEQELKKKFKVSQIRMPGSELAASKIEKKLDFAAESFSHIVCAWSNKSLHQSASATKALLGLVSIHPTLIYAALISRGKHWNDMDIFDLNRYDSHDKDLYKISPVAQIFFILAMCDYQDNLEVLQDWVNDHVIQKSYLRESYLGDSKLNLDDENLAKFKDFVESIIKPFPNGNNILIELAYENKIETVSYLFNLCDLYMVSVGNERKIKDELLQVKGGGEGTALDVALNFDYFEILEVLITRGGVDINKVDKDRTERYDEMKAKKDAEKKTEAFLKRHEEDMSSDLSKEEKLKKTYGVNNIRMPGSAILASKIEKKLVNVTASFEDAIWGWANIYKGIKRTVESMGRILQSTPIHPSLLFARMCKDNSFSMNPFALEQYCSDRSGNFDYISPVAQMFFILAVYGDLQILQDWMSDHVPVAEIKNLLEDLIKSFPNELNVLVELTYWGKMEMIEYLFNLCDTYGKELNIKRKLCCAKERTGKTALAVAIDENGDWEMADFLITNGASIYQVGDEIWQEYHRMKAEFYGELSEELTDENKDVRGFFKRQQEFINTSNKRQKNSEQKPDEDANFDLEGSSNSKLEF